MTSDHDDDHHWVVDVKLLIENGSAHHLDIFQCIIPGYLVRDSTLEPSNEVVWDCGLTVDSGIPGIMKGPRCNDPIDYLVPFEWDKKDMTDEFGIGLKVGPKSPFNYLVIEVHFAEASKAQVNSRAGFDVKILTSNNSTRLKSAGMLILGTIAGTIPPHSMGYFDSACEYRRPPALNCIRYRSHTHGLGLIASGFKISKDGSQYQLLGKQFPQHTFPYFPLESIKGHFPLESIKGQSRRGERIVRIERGDVLAARCIMNNTRDIEVAIGERAEDEMCYFYLIYYVDSGESIPFPFRHCYTSANDYSWQIDAGFTTIFKQIDLISNIPPPPRIFSNRTAG